MGFLSGVLKDVSEKQPYSVGKEKLNEAVNELKNSLSTGRKGFEVIEQVARKVGEYNGLLKDRNNEVRKKITDLDDDITKIRNKVKETYPTKNDNDDEPNADKIEKSKNEVTQTVEKCTQLAKAFKRDILNLKDKIKDLGHEANEQITNASDNVEREGQRLGRVQQNEKEQYEEMEREIKEAMRTLQESVDSQINSKVNDLVCLLRERVQRILKELQKIDSQLFIHVEQLQKWIKEADEIAHQLAKHAIEIELWTPGSQNEPAIRKKTDELRQKGETLFAKFKEAKVHVEENVKIALTRVKSMDEALKGDLYKVKQAVEEKVTGIKEAIGKLYETVSGKRDTASSTIAQVIATLQSDVDAIKGGPPGKGGLDCIRKNVESHAKEFSHFEATVKKWIDGILKSDVKAWIGDYVKNNQKEGTFKNGYGEKTDGVYNNLNVKITEAIMKQIKQKLGGNIFTPTARTKEAKEEGSIKHNVDYVRKVCMNFASRLHGQIAVSAVVDDVIEWVCTANPGSQSGKSDLKKAIEETIEKLVMRARDAGNQFSWLAGTEDLTGKVDEVSKKSEELHGKLEGATSGGTTPAAAVDTAINKVTETLGEQLPKGKDDSHVKFPDDPIFKDYKAYVKQGSQGIEKDALTGTTGEGSLPAAIGAIREQGNKDFEAASEDAQNGAIFNILSEEIKKNIKELLRAYERVGRAMNQKLDKLKLNKLGMKDARKGSLQELHNQLSALQSKTFKDAMDWTKTFQSLATTNCKKAIEELKSHVDQQVETATEKLTTQAKKHYVSTLKTELQNFTARVQGHLTGLPTLIDKDLVQGYKGLMKSVQGVKFIVIKNEDPKFEDVTDTSLFTKLKDAVPLPPGQEKPTKEHFKALVSAFEHYFNNIHGYVKNEIKRLNEQHEQTLNYKLTHAESEYNKKVNASRLDGVHNELTKVIHQLKVGMRYDRYVPGLLDGLSEAIDGLRPECYALSSTPLLDCIGSGLRGLAGELRMAYISVYDCAAYDFNWDADGRKCAKVCLTSLATLSNDFVTFGEKCKEARFQRIYASSKNNKNVLGDFLSDCGFIVSKSYNGQDTELRNKEDFTGTIIYKTLLQDNKRDIANIPSVVEWMKEKNTQNNITPAQDSAATTIDIFQLHDYLYGCLKSYYEVCHYATLSSTKYPSSLFQMLCWLTGLPHSPIYQNFSLNGFSDLFPKPKEHRFENEGDFISIEDTDDVPLAAHPENITVGHLTGALTDVCTQSHTVLTSILGHGHAGGTYAVDFNTNPNGFTYPPATGSCFDMLCDVLNRLYQQLFFLYSQCSNGEPSVSWRDCWYGNQVGGSAWSCNTMQCPNQKGNQIHKEKCNQKCDQTAQCGIKSPLQSFLEDGLQGFLPHSFTKPGCKLECSYSNHRGIPCRTPMGFADISVAASHRQTGDYLKKVLEDFCGSESAPLTKLCAQLNCLLQKPPQTLGDIFAFYYGYLGGWANDFYRRSQKEQAYTRDAFMQAVNDAYFGKQYDDLNPITLVSSSKHSGEHSKGNLCSIANCMSGSVPPCGLYVKSMTQEISRYYSADHKANHLSWIVYITETFCDLLKKLYDDCCKKCGPAGSRCHVKSCVENCQVKYTDSTGKPTTLSPTHNHSTYCKSIVTCRDTHPTLYRYGFTFGHPWGLNGSGNNEGAKRTCKDFCEALIKMLDKESVLIELRKKIDAFLWAIRTPFSYLVLALWSLSLFYLLCVMVGRLDVLHIRSHLRIPSSHKITAQSLLAAAQVGRLAKISYLQP